MSLAERLSTIGPPRDDSLAGRRDRDVEPPDPAVGGLVQRCVIIQRDEKGYGFTVSGDNPVFVASVKPDGAASRAGVQQGDRIVKVNGTLVTSRNHLDVVKLIKSGSYVALTLLGKPHPSGHPGITPTSNISTNRDSVSHRVTAPQPVDPDKDRELWQQKVHMTRAMFEQAKEDFEKLQHQYVTKPSEKLHSQLLEKERTVKALDNQLKQLTGEETTVPASLVPISNRFSDSEHRGFEHSAVQSWRMSSPTSAKHVKPSSVPSLVYKSRESSPAEMRQASVARSKSDAATRKSKTASTFYVGPPGTNDLEATSLPTTTSDLGSMSDSPQTSPSVSPTPNDPHSGHNGQDMEDSVMGSGEQIITIDDEDAHSEDDQVNDPGPFADIKLLENKPAHMAILLNYLISNSDPAPVLFHIISEQYSRSTGNIKELRKWAYEIYSTFIAQTAPLSIGSVDDSIISQIDNILTTSATRTDNEQVLRNMFQPARQAVQFEITDLLSDFRNKKDLGMGNFYGFQKIHDNMDRAQEVKVAEELLVPILELFGSEDSNRTVSRDQATAWALATFLRICIGSKPAHSSTLDRVQTFMMKDKRSIKFPGTSSKRAKALKGHQFSPQHFYVSTCCNFCGTLIWGVGYQGFQCQNCEMNLHKQCVEEITETCGGKKGKRTSRLIPVIQTRRQSTNNQGQSQPYSIDQLHLGFGRPGEGKNPPNAEPHSPPSIQPYPKDDDTELAGLPSGHSVKSIVNRYQGLTSPTGPGPGQGGLGVPDAQAGGAVINVGSNSGDRRGSTDLNRSGSLNNKGEKGDRPARRAKSDVDVDSDAFKAINQSGSSSASSLSNRSIESPGNSTDNVSDVVRALQEDPDLDCEAELPSLKQVLGEDVLRKLKPKEKKRQEVINELFYTERAHLRNLKILDLLFYRPMLNEKGLMLDLARALFPNMEEMISLHVSIVKDIRERSQSQPVVKDVGDILLKRFDGEAGEKFRKGCAEYCRNQAFALDALKKQTRKEPKLQQFLNDAESNALCRRLQLKDLVPSQMQRVTKYPLLIDNLLKYTQPNSEEHKKLERAQEKCKHILAYVNQAVRECESYHKVKDISKKLDRRSVDASSDPALADLKNLDLTQHKLIFDGPLTWKLRSHRALDMHVLLFEDILVLLQKQDDKYVLKCQNTNVQTSVRDDFKFTHSPVLKLQNLLARNLATDKRSFFVVNILEVRAQMYEFSAATSELRVKWCKLINDKAEELKKSSNISSMRSSSIHVPQLQQVEIERSKISRISRKDRSGGGLGETDALEQNVDSLSNLDVGEDLSSEGELIQPEEVNVSDAIMVEAAPVRSPLELFRRNGELLEETLLEREQLTAELLNLSWDQYRAITQRSNSLVSRAREEDEDEVDFDEEELKPEFLLAKALDLNNRFIRLINSSTLTLAQQHQPQQQQQQLQQQQQQQLDEEAASPSSPSRPLSTLSQGESSASEAESSSSGVSSQPQQSRLVAHQANLNVPVPMDQLKSMANEMNEILAKLMTAMNSGSEERHRLRKELVEAQQKLDALKAIQKQMTEAGTVPSGRSSPRVPLSPPSGGAPDIPSTTPAISSTTTTMTTTATAAGDMQLKEVAAAVSTVPSAGESAITKVPASQESVEETIMTGVEEVVHQGIQEATLTQLEESVEALALASDPAEVVQAVATETRTCEASGGEMGPSEGSNVIEVSIPDEDYDDDDNNEVSVADLPLPEVVSIPEGDDDLQTSSRLLDVVDLDDSETESDDNDTLTSKTSHQEFPSLTTTVEDVLGEEREEEEEDTGSVKTLVGHDPENLRKESTSSSVVDTEIITVGDDRGGGDGGGDGGRAHKSKQDEDGSSVDAEKSEEEGGGGDTGETTQPIQI